MNRNNPLRGINLLAVFVFFMFSIGPSRILFSQSNLDSLKSVYENTENDIEDRFDALKKYGVKRFINTDLDSAYHYGQMLLSMAESEESPKYIAKSTSELFKVHFYKGEFDICLEVLERGLEIANKNNLKTEILILNADIAPPLIRLGRYERAEKHLLLALELGKEQENHELTAKVYLNLGAIYSNTGRTEEATKIYLSAIKFIKDKELANRLSPLYNNLGAIEANYGNLKVAQDYFFLSLKEDIEKNNERSMASTYLRLGELMLTTEDLELALEYLSKTIEIAERLDENVRLGSALMLKGIALKRQKKYSESYESFKKSLSKLNEAQYLKGMAGTSVFLGEYFKETNQLDSAEYYFRKGLEIRSKINDVNGIGHCHYLLGELALENDNLYLSKKEAYLALKSARERNFLSGKESSYHLLYEIYDRENRPDSALHYVTLYQTAKDSLEREENNNELLRSRYESDYIVKQIKDSLNFVAKEKIHQAEIKSRKRSQLFLVIGLILLFLVIYLFRVRQYSKQREELQAVFSRNLIRGQEDERTRVARDLHDSVGQKLMLLTKKTKEFGDENVSALAGSTLDELRSISRSLHPASLERLGITSAIQSLINEVDANTETFFTHDIENIDELFETEQELHLYRIIQEVINNMVKHAEAKSASITLERKPKHVLINIKDDGKGFNVSEKIAQVKSLGMKTLMERSKIINSHIKIDSQLGQGTTVNLNISLST